MLNLERRRARESELAMVMMLNVQVFDSDGISVVGVVVEVY